MATRSATEEDIDAIRRVAERSWTTDYPDILTRETAEEGVSDWYTASQIATELEEARTLLLVAEREESVVGFAHATWNEAEGDGYILRIYVHPEHRQESAGRELLERTCAELADHDIERINAMVLVENELGNAFYEQFGFELVDEQETMIGGESYPENRYRLDAPFELDVD